MTRNHLHLLATLLLILLGHAFSLQYDPYDPEKIVHTVFRGSTKPPETVRLNGGFFPPMPTLSLGRKLYPGELSKAVSLFHHHMGSSLHYGLWISTTSDFVAAMNSTMVVGSPQVKTYLYVISCDAKMVDLRASIGEDLFSTTHPLSLPAEYPAILGIPWTQIEGWYDTQNFTAEQTAHLVEYPRPLPGYLTRNPDFDKSYSNKTCSGAQPQLAGFSGRSKMAVEAMKKEPWSTHVNASTSPIKRFIDFFHEVGSDIKVSAKATPVYDDPTIFTWRDPVGMSDLLGRLDVGEVRYGYLSPILMAWQRGVPSLARLKILHSAMMAEKKNKTSSLKTDKWKKKKSKNHGPWYKENLYKRRWSKAEPPASTSGHLEGRAETGFRPITIPPFRQFVQDDEEEGGAGGGLELGPAGEMMDEEIMDLDDAFADLTSESPEDIEAWTAIENYVWSPEWLNSGSGNMVMSTQDLMQELSESAAVGEAGAVEAVGASELGSEMANAAGGAVMSEELSAGTMILNEGATFAEEALMATEGITFETGTWYFGGATAEAAVGYASAAEIVELLSIFI